MQTTTIESLHFCPRCQHDIAAGPDPNSICDGCEQADRFNAMERLRQASIRDAKRAARPVGFLVVAGWLLAIAGVIYAIFE